MRPFRLISTLREIFSSPSHFPFNGVFWWNPSYFQCSMASWSSTLSQFPGCEVSWCSFLLFSFSWGFICRVSPWCRYQNLICINLCTTVIIGGFFFIPPQSCFWNCMLSTCSSYSTVGAFIARLKKKICFVTLRQQFY